METFQKILIANRGEIAIRIAEAAKAMGIPTIAIYAHDDVAAEHIKHCEEKALLIGNTLTETYLNIQQIIDLALIHKADAIHPGYGFLSENATFVEACEKANIVFIGPSVASMKIMGDKIKSREFARNAGVPLLTGAEGSPEEILAKKEELEYPVIIKPSAGGGGKGMRIIDHARDLEQGIADTAREALSYFGDGTVFAERYIRNPRHIEVQVLGDQMGNVIHLYERECTIQRRHQKVIEEAPSKTLNVATRNKICNNAVKLSKAANYYSVGTVEYIMDEDGSFYFMEMNTRVQVEHPVTEMITGIDIVQEQIKIAQGKTLGFVQEDISINGHAIECRVYAEDPLENFRPSPGNISLFSPILVEDGRLDSTIPLKIGHLSKPYTISPSYDPMIAKSIVHAKDRDTAIDQAIIQLNNIGIYGLKNNVAYLRALLSSAAFKENRISTNFIKTEHHQIVKSSLAGFENGLAPAIATFLIKELSILPADSIWKVIGKQKTQQLSLQIKNNEYEVSDIVIDENNVSFQLDTKKIYFLRKNLTARSFSITNALTVILLNGYSYPIKRKKLIDRDINYTQENIGKAGNTVNAPIPGTIINVLCAVGDQVKTGQEIVVLEAMKMENTLKAPRDGEVESINCSTGDKVNAGKALITLQA